MCTGEQWGKSYAAAMWAFGQTFKPKKPSQPKELGWIVGKHYDMTRFVHDYLREIMKKSGLGSGSDIANPGIINVAGGVTVRTKSALDAESLMGESPDWIVVDEAAQLPWDSMLRVFTRAGPKRARIFICSTMEGSIGWFPETVKLWEQPAVQQRENVKAFTAPSWDNPFLYPGGRQDPEILRLEAQLPADVFNERIAAIAAPPKGLVHGTFRSNIHAAETVEFIPGREIFIGIDPGRSHEGSAYAVVACHYIERQVRIFDVVYVSGKTSDDVVEIVTNKPWWKQGPMRGVIDQAGAQHKSNSALSDADIWAKAQLPCSYQYVPIIEGIRRVNSMLKIDPITGKPRMVIDPHNGVGLIAEWGGCASPLPAGGIRVYQWESNREGEILGGVPRDRYNDASKALAYLISFYFRQEYGDQSPNASTKVKIKRYTVSSTRDYSFR